MQSVSIRNMVKIKHLAAGAVLALFAIAAAQAQGTAAANAPTSVTAQAPDALVRTLSNDVLEAIKKDKALQSGDLSRLNALVDEKILPYVNFEKMTQLAVGRGWRQATPEQRQLLTKEFRALLVRTYSGAVSVVKDHQVQMRPFRGQPSDTDVLVRTQVVPSRGDPIQLDYRVEKTESGWKIYDVSVLGVWLVENYKSQFSSEITQNGIDGLIKAMTERNRQLDGAAKKS